MPRIQRDITVDQPIGVVWDYLADFRHTEEWDPPTLRTVRSSGDGGVGTVYRNTSKVLGRELQITYTVIEHREPRRLRLRGRSSAMTQVDTIDLEEADGATTVHYSAELELGRMGRLAAPLVRYGLRKLGDEAAGRMARRLRALDAPEPDRGA